MDTYERTYSQLLQVQLANDRAIAAALSVDEQPRPPPEADTSLDGQLALQLHEKEVEKLGELCSPRSWLVLASVLFHMEHACWRECDSGQAYEDSSSCCFLCMQWLLHPDDICAYLRVGVVWCAVQCGLPRSLAAGARCFARCSAPSM
jgi:hypothetical protein